MRKTNFCKNGHELTPENSRVRADRRGCIECIACLTLARKRFNTRNPLYDIWKTMIRRCVDPGFKDWGLYGGRVDNPVTVCERWENSYDNFVADVGTRPSSKHTLDRKDGTMGYFPGNVRWATAKEQARNTSVNRFIEFNGARLTLAEWAERSGQKYMTLYQRLERGIPFERAIDPSPLPQVQHVRNVEGRFTSGVLPRPAD